jgi:hypothetical protein
VGKKQDFLIFGKPLVLFGPYVVIQRQNRPHGSYDFQDVEIHALEKDCGHKAEAPYKYSIDSSWDAQGTLK